MNTLNKRHTKWLVTGAGTLINFFLGITYAWSLLAHSLVENFGWSQAEAALPYTIMIIFYTSSMVPAGRVQDRLGGRIVTTFGGLLAGPAFIFASFFPTPNVMPFLFGCFYGIGLACCYASATPAAVKWFPLEKRGMVAGIVVSGTGAAAFFGAPLIQFLLQQYGILPTMRLIGMAILLGVLLLAQFLREPEKKQKPSQTSEENKSFTPAKLIFLQLIKIRQFYLMWFAFLLTSATGMMFIAHLSGITFSVLNAPWGHTMIALFALFSTLGRLASGYFSDRLGRIRTMTLFFALMAFFWLLILLIQNLATLILTTSVIGFTYGSLYTLFPAAVVSFFGTKNFGFTFGLLFTSVGAASVLGPFLGGFLYDIYNSYNYSFLLALVSCLAAVGLAIGLNNASQKIAVKKIL